VITSRLAGPLRLIACTGIVAVAWLVVLPWFGRQSPIERHIRVMEEGGVNPAAMVYTELERLPLRPGWIEDHLVLWPSEKGTQPFFPPASAGGFWWPDHFLRMPNNTGSGRGRADPLAEQAVSCRQAEARPTKAKAVPNRIGTVGQSRRPGTRKNRENFTPKNR
jgi:hypothetical protein